MEIEKVEKVEEIKEIKEIKEPPEYISRFVSGNIEQLEIIYNEGMEFNETSNKGILYFNCSEKENIMDVQFVNDTVMENFMSKELVSDIINNTESDKKLLFINDIDLKTVFLIQI